jgi:hypothetical protein
MTIYDQISRSDPLLGLDTKLVPTGADSVIIADAAAGNVAKQALVANVDPANMSSGASALGQILMSDGAGGMGWADISFVDGLVTAPGAPFTLDPDTGFYRIGNDHFGAACNGLLIQQWLSTGAYILDTHIKTDSVELSALGSGDRTTYVDFRSDDTNLDYSARLQRLAGVNGDVSLINKGVGPFYWIRDGNTEATFYSQNTLLRRTYFTRLTDPTYDEAGATLDRAIGFDTGSTISIAANKEFDAIRWDQTVTIGDGAIVAFGNGNLVASASSHANSNLYGWLVSCHNAGPGTIKGLYGSAAADAGCTGNVVGGVVSCVTRTGVANSRGLQLAMGSADAKAIDYVLDVYDINAGVVSIDYGLLFESSCSIGVTAIQAFAVGAGDFLRWLNAAGDAFLFRVDSVGDVYRGVNKVLGSRVVDARLADVPNSGDATTDGVIAALQSVILTHGLGAAA